MNGDLDFACPLPIVQYSQIVMAHGGGGRLMAQLLETLIQPAFANPYLAAQHDSAVFEVGGQRLAFTTDSYVVKPINYEAFGHAIQSLGELLKTMKPV